ncbi:MAG: DegT/DnrJ/EryC1/StrS family aminotransferase [Calditrichaeota bacterium]|nr:DegT/DnrJ/EryC1/StrS family aminotransferase [Calditrichota bacterium]
MKVPFVDLRTQYYQIKDEILSSLEMVCENTSFILGPFVQRFEKNFSKYVGVKHCIGLNSGTSANYLSVKAIIQPGDEVITVPNTFIATTEAITAAGGKPVFVDIEEDSYNMDPEKIEAAITKKTRAIVPVHLYGQPADMDPILEIAKRYNLFVIEDAAQAHGAKYKEQNVGSIGDIAAFSFYPGKNLGAYGEAGALTTNSDEIADYARKFRDHGSREKYVHEIEGFNMRMEGFQGAVLDIKLKYLENWNDARRRNAAYYCELLKDVDNVILPREMPYARHVYHLFVVRVKERERLQQFLKDKGIATGFHYKYPLHLQKAYQYLGYKEGDFPVTEKVMKEIISLPMYPELHREQIEYVVDSIRDFYRCK